MSRLSFPQDLLSKHSKLLHTLAEIDSADPCSTPFSTVSISSLLQGNISSDQISSGSSSSLASSDNLSGVWPTQTDGDSVFRTSSAMSLTSTMPQRRMTRSKSLDDMLVSQVRQKSLKRPGSIKRRVGGSKFYTEELLTQCNKGQTKDVIIEL